MLREIANITHIQKLYLQLLYRCNFSCQHCFHGEKLKWKDAYTASEAKAMIDMFRAEYGANTVTLLGGEPFLHHDLPEIVRHAKGKGMEIEICTNGYRISSKLDLIYDAIDNLRVSIEGLEQSNDIVRRSGSYAAAMDTIRHATHLGIRTSVTTTVTSGNVGEIAELARVISGMGVVEMKLHCLRLVGNAADHPELLPTGPDPYAGMYSELEKVSAETNIRITFDEDLSPECAVPTAQTEAIEKELDRIEIQPDGQLYVSCKAVGADNSAFFYRKESGQIEYRPRANDELSAGVPQVHYSRLTRKIGVQ